MKPLFACTACLVLLTACRNEGGKGVILETSIEKFIPNDTVVLTGVRVELMKTTPLYQRLVKEQKLAALDEFAKKTSIDPRKDLKEIVLASNGHDTVIIARGNIASPQALEKALEDQGATRSTAGKYTLLNRDGGAVSFVSNSIALAGPRELLEKLLQGQGGDDARKRAILDRVAKLPEDKHVWAVATGGFAPVKLPDTGNLANLIGVFQRLETVTMTVDLKDGLSLMAMGQCIQAKDAKQLHDLLRGLIGFGRLSTPSDKPELLRFFDGIKVENTDKTVKINAEVPMDMVEMLLSLTGANKRGA